MSDVTVWKQWDSLIRNIIRESLIELGDLIEDKIKASIDKHVYVGQNKIYEPTYEFRESWEVCIVNKNKDDFEVVIKSNPDKMTVDTSPDVNRHGSNFPNGKPEHQDIRDYLPELLADNWSGDAFGYGFWRNRTNYFEEVVRELKANGWLNKKFKQLLRKRGLTVS